MALDAVVGLCQALNPAHRAEVVRTLSQITMTEQQETGPTVNMQELKLN